MSEDRERVIVRKRSGLGNCLISANLYAGKIRVHAIRICESEEEAVKLLAEYEASGDGSYGGIFYAKVWIEES